MTSTTPVYDFPYLDGMDGGKHIKLVSKSLALRLEAVLINEGQVPLDADLVSLLQRVAALEGAGADDTGWQVLPLSSGWVAYGSGYQSPRYRRHNGVVYVEGMVKSGSTAPGAVIATLPPGCRPPAQIPVATPTNGAAGTCEVQANGTITAMSVTNSWLSLQFTFHLT